MKRFLSILLCLALVLPGTSVLAAPTGIFYTGGAVSDLREYHQDFEDSDNLLQFPNTKTGKDSQTYFSYQFAADKAGDRENQYHTEDYLFEATGNNRYMSVRQTSAKKSEGSVNPVIGPWLGVSGMADGEKAHYSFYILNKDFIYDKEVFFAVRNRTKIGYKLVKMDTSGIMTFGYDSDSAVSVGYSLNRWYKIDLIATNNASGNDTIKMYLDGKHMTTTEYADIMKVSSDVATALTFSIFSDVEYTGTDTSVFCFDNIYAKMYAADETMPTITPRKNAYLGFEGMHTNSVGADGFKADSSNTAFTYNKVTGALGKESTDTSMKLTAASTGSADAYEFDMANIKSDGNFAAGSQLKFSTSYAYKTGGGADTLELEGTSSGEALFTVNRSNGVLSAAGSSDTFTLESEKWYNLDTILTANADSTLGYTIYVNGIPKITGTLDIASLKGTGAVINKLIINTAMDNSTPGEAYLDDMYAAAGTVTANAPIENSAVELAQNGKVGIPVGYNVAELLSDTTGPVKVIKNGESVTSGTAAEDDLVVVGDLTPVFGYVQAKLKLNTPTAVFSSGKVTVSEDLVSIQSESIDLTLITVVYKDGKIYSVNADSQTCATGTTTLSVSDVAVPEGGTIKIFTTCGWDAKTPIFDDRVYTASASAPVTKVTPDSSINSDASASFEVGTFDFETSSIKMSGTIGNGGVKTAVAYIVPKDADITILSDSNLPVFADVITTDANGRFKLTAKFHEGCTAFVNGNYDAYVYSKDLATPLKAAFMADREKVILDAINASGTWDAMKGIILGEDLDGNHINSNFTYINPDLSYYSLLNDIDTFFIELFKVKSSIAVYSDIKTQFAKVAQQRYIAENTVIIGGGGGGGKKPSGTGMTIDPPVNTDNTQSGAASYFNDMSGHWAEPYVNSLYKEGIVNGYEDGSYAPDNFVNRAEIVKLISAAFGINGGTFGEYTDVSADSWYAPYVYGASANGIAKGFEGKFRPLDLVTREDAAVMLHRAIERTHDLGIGYVFFADETSISSYAVEQVSALAQIGVITGNEKNEFAPKGSLTRGEAAALILRAIDYILAH